MAGEVRVKEREVNISEMFQQMQAGAIVTYTAEYAQYVEFPTAYSGTQPPFDPIHKWVQRKWGDLDEGLKTSDQGAPLTQRQVAWKVVHILKEHGTEGVYFGKRGLNAAKASAGTIAQQYQGSGDPEAPRKIVAEVAKVGFNKGQAIISQEATDTGNLLQSGSVELVEDPSEIPTGGGGE